ncbi:putative pterin-4-alpha-carbinolamine dehydratase [Balamuthia mandrillaris]
MSAKSKLLEGAKRAEVLRSLQGWQECTGRDAIRRSFLFRNFRSAFDFMAHVAIFADQKNHHPEWCNTYNKVDVTLSTHSAGGVTEKDVELATFMDDTAKRYK